MEMDLTSRGCGARSHDDDDDDAAATVRIAVKDAKNRCTALINRIESLSLGSCSCKSKSHVSWKQTLLRLVRSELSFLTRLSLSSDEHYGSFHVSSHLSSNVGHLEAIVYILQQPFLAGISRVCKPVPLSSSAKNGKETVLCRNVHVDVVCTVNGNPAWFIVSDRNPKYISWLGSCKSKGLRTRIEQILDAAYFSVAFKPSSLLLFFSNGLDDCIYKKVQDEFGATNFEYEFSKFDCEFMDDLEGEWINVFTRSYEKACIIEIKLICCENSASAMENEVKGSLQDAARQHSLSSHDITGQSLGSSFYTLISRMKFCDNYVEHCDLEDILCESNFINYDTTALIAIVSGISNGCTENILATPESELRSRFKSNYDFVIAQVMSEIENPMHLELDGVISGKFGIICESVHSEFKELVSMCGGPREKLRADHVLKHLMVVPDRPSARMISLPTTRKVAMKNKVVFGTGDYWHSPTLTANMAFVRAISQTGMSLFTIEHRPRALTGT